MSGPETRCSPSCVTDIIEVLPPAAKQRIKDLGCSKLLELKLSGLGSRVLISEFMSKGIVGADEIEFRVTEDMSIWFTKNVVKDVLPMPAGSIKELPKSQGVEKEYDNWLKALMYVSMKEKQENRNQNTAQDMEDAPDVDQENQNAAQDTDMDDISTAHELKAEHKRSYFTPKNIALLAKNFGDEKIS